MIEQHPWEPFLPSNSKILFLGSFPPQKGKWGIDFYYPNKQNDFWRIIGKVFYDDYLHFFNLTSKQFDKDTILKFISQKGIAMGDCAYEVKRLKGNASDKFLEIIKPLDILSTLSKIPNCLHIATTGTKAAEILADITNTKIPKMGNYTVLHFGDRIIKIFRMPSTSRAYPLSINKKVLYYRQLFIDTDFL